MQVYRSLLFIPGNKPKWMANINQTEADAIILDLEDSVPDDEKANAREHVKAALEQWGHLEKPALFVRINRSENGMSVFEQRDIEAAMQPGLSGIVLPKVYDPHEINQLSDELTIAEKRKGMESGNTKLLPILETAKSMYFCYDIAMCERVIGITGLSSKNGDVERALGTQWTFEGTETLYMKSKVVMAARAAGVTPIGGLWQDVHNLEDLKVSAKKNRQLGFDGELVLHPSNVAIINETYSPSESEIAYYRGLIDAFHDAKEKGNATVMYEGSHIDYAHVQTAKNILEFSKVLSKS